MQASATKIFPFSPCEDAASGTTFPRLDALMELLQKQSQFFGSMSPPPSPQRTRCNVNESPSGKKKWPTEMEKKLAVVVLLFPRRTQNAFVLC